MQRKTWPYDPTSPYTELPRGHDDTEWAAVFQSDEDSADDPTIPDRFTDGWAQAHRNDVTGENASHWLRFLSDYDRATRGGDATVSEDEREPEECRCGNCDDALNDEGRCSLCAHHAAMED